MGSIGFKKEYINIVEILKSTIALGPYRGHEVWTEIEALMDRVLDHTLALIDLRKVIWFDSAFFQPAFGPIFQALADGRWPRKYIIFQIHDIHKPGFFQGILKSFGKDIPRKKSECEFVAVGMYTKLIIGDEESISFVGHLSTSENAILDIVNSLRQTTPGQVMAKSGLAQETVFDIFRSLAQKYFIVEYSDEYDQGYHYYSFYNYLTKE